MPNLPDHPEIMEQFEQCKEKFDFEHPEHRATRAAPPMVPPGKRRSPRIACEVPVDGVAALTNATSPNGLLTIPFVYTHYTDSYGYELELNAVTELCSLLAERRQLHEFMEI